MWKSELYLRWMTLLLLLCTEFVLIVRPSGDIPVSTTRHDRSFLYNRSPAQLQAHAKQVNVQPSDISKIKLEDIFQLGNDPGIILFNDTSSPPFKVQRSPDGKLSVVFNDFLIFQRTTETPTTTNSNVRTKTETKYETIEQNDGIVCKGRLEGKSYCQDVPNYEKQAQLNKISTEQLAKFQHYFNDDLIQPPNVTQRMNFSPGLENDFCHGRTTLINPQGAETKDAKWMLILQDQNHKQGVSVELCENEDGECTFPGSMNLGYHTKCKQYHAFRTMVVIKDGELREESVKLPNCCKCVYWQS